jgi:hypothetical protein
MAQAKQLTTSPRQARGVQEKLTTIMISEVRLNQHSEKVQGQCPEPFHLLIGENTSLLTYFVKSYKEVTDTSLVRRYRLLTPL